MKKLILLLSVITILSSCTSQPVVTENNNIEKSSRIILKEQIGAFTIIQVDSVEYITRNGGGIYPIGKIK